MGLFDIILLIIIGGFAMFGFWFGLIHTLGSLLGTVFGAYLAARFYEPMAGWLMGITGWGGNAAKVVMFIIAFLIINRLVGFAFWIFDKTIGVITRLPFINSLNRFSGLILGAFEGAVTLGLIIYFIERFPLSDKFMSWLAESIVAPYLSGIAAVLLPLLPEALKILKSTVDYMQNIFLK